MLRFYRWLLGVVCVLLLVDLGMVLGVVGMASPDVVLNEGRAWGLVVVHALALLTAQTLRDLINDPPRRRRPAAEPVLS